MQVCKSIEKIQGGYLVEIRVPYAYHSDGGRRICATWPEVVKLLTLSADESLQTPAAASDWQPCTGSHRMYLSARSGGRSAWVCMHCDGEQDPETGQFHAPTEMA